VAHRKEIPAAEVREYLELIELGISYSVAANRTAHRFDTWTRFYEADPKFKKDRDAARKKGNAVWDKRVNDWAIKALANDSNNAPFAAKMIMKSREVEFIDPDLKGPERLTRGGNLTIQALTQIIVENVGDDQSRKKVASAIRKLIGPDAEPDGGSDRPGLVRKRD
jgi:hypothetical protein